jgi:hypothetical protein
MVEGSARWWPRFTSSFQNMLAASSSSVVTGVMPDLCPSKLLLKPNITWPGERPRAAGTTCAWCTSAVSRGDDHVHVM